MATILNSKKSTIGSPYVYYTIEAKTSNRTINGITIKFDITAWLGSSGSSLGSGSTMGIIGYLKVLGTEYSVTIKGTSDKWSGTTKHTVSKTITIETGLNPIDTSITGITFRTTRTGSANDGEIANSGELGATACSNITFEAAHTPPTDVTYTMVETNQKLIDAGIKDDVFVKGLSIKLFNISGTVYDDATIKKYAIFNRLNVFSTTTLPVIVDLTQNELQTDLTYVSQIPIRAQIVDSFETAGYSTNDLYEYIQYNRINLVETSTTVKRNGQLSGKTKLNVKGNLFNGIVGNVDQSTYKPIVKYKFWQTGTEEPTSYDYEIPSDNITIENGVFSVSNYEIGSSVETDINWFNPDNAYKVKIYIEDNFTNYESQEKSIPVGEATWTEYRDRVDFKKITIKGTEIFPVGYVYMSVDPTSPEILFGGKWEQIKDKFLLGAGDTYEAGTSGGSDTHKHGLTSGWANINSSGKTIIYQYKAGTSWKANYQVVGSSGSSSSTSYSDVTTLGGTTDNGNNMPPYLTVYMWKRIE